MNSAKTIGELIKILLRDEYLDFLLTYKKVPLWCIDAAGKGYNIVKDVDSIDLNNGLDMASELSLSLCLAVIGKDIDLDETVWLLDQYNKRLDVYKDLRYNTFKVSYMHIPSNDILDYKAARDVVEDLLFDLCTGNSYPVSIDPIK